MIELYNGEKIIMEIRRHWIAIFRATLIAAVLTVSPFAAKAGIGVLGIQISDPIINALLLFITAGWLLFVLMFYAVAWTNHYLDVLVLTSRRLIDIEQHGLFSRNIAELPWKTLQDISIEVSGLLATLFDFGDIHIQTAGATREFVIRNVPRPHRVKDALMRCHENYHQSE